MQRFAQSPSLEAAPLARTHCSDGPVCRFVSCTRARGIAFPRTVKELVVMAGYRGMFDRTGGSARRDKFAVSVAGTWLGCRTR